MKSNSPYNSWAGTFLMLILAAVAVISVMWIVFESNRSRNLETVSHFKQQMIQTSGDRKGPWEYVNTSGVTQKTKDCTKTEDFWTGSHCAETEEGNVVFRYQSTKSGNISHAKLTVDGKQLELNCVKLGDNFFVQRNHCGVGV
jgi:hypothetical protein